MNPHLLLVNMADFSFCSALCVIVLPELENIPYEFVCKQSCGPFLFHTFSLCKSTSMRSTGTKRNTRLYLRDVTLKIALLQANSAEESTHVRLFDAFSLLPDLHEQCPQELNQ